MSARPEDRCPSIACPRPYCSPGACDCDPCDCVRCLARTWGLPDGWWRLMPAGPQERDA